MQVRQNRIHGAQHETQIRLTVFAQWRRHTKNERVDLGHTRKIRRRFEIATDKTCKIFGTDMFDVGTAVAERIHLRLVDVEADDVVAHFAVAEHKWKADIPES